MLHQRNINIKAFGDVPMADMEIVFPKKNIYISWFSMLQLGIMFAIAVVSHHQPSACMHACMPCQGVQRCMYTWLL
jgi:hypothetical protein